MIGRFSGLSSFLLPKTDTFQWLYRKDLPHYEIAIDFTAAGTAPEFHRIPFSSNMKAPRRLQIYKYYFEAIPFLATFATKKKEN